MFVVYPWAPKSFTFMYVGLLLLLCGLATSRYDLLHLFDNKGHPFKDASFTDGIAIDDFDKLYGIIYIAIGAVAFLIGLINLHLFNSSIKAFQKVEEPEEEVKKEQEIEMTYMKGPYTAVAGEIVIAKETFWSDCKIEVKIEKGMVMMVKRIDEEGDFTVNKIEEPYWELDQWITDANFVKIAKAKDQQQKMKETPDEDADYSIMESEKVDKDAVDSGGAAVNLDEDRLTAIDENKELETEEEREENENPPLEMVEQQRPVAKTRGLSFLFIILILAQIAIFVMWMEQDMRKYKHKFPASAFFWVVFGGLLYFFAFGQAFFYTNVKGSKGRLVTVNSLENSKNNSHVHHWCPCACLAAITGKILLFVGLCSCSENMVTRCLDVDIMSYSHSKCVGWGLKWSEPHYTSIAYLCCGVLCVLLAEHCLKTLQNEINRYVNAGVRYDVFAPQLGMGPVLLTMLLWLGQIVMAILWFLEHYDETLVESLNIKYEDHFGSSLYFTVLGGLMYFVAYFKIKTSTHVVCKDGSIFTTPAPQKIGVEIVPKEFEPPSESYHPYLVHIKNRKVEMESGTGKRFQKQLVRNKISQGWKIFKIDDEDFDLELLVEKQKGDKNYTLEMEFVLSSDKSRQEQMRDLKVLKIKGMLTDEEFESATSTVQSRCRSGTHMNLLEPLPNPDEEPTEEVGEETNL